MSKKIIEDIKLDLFKMKDNKYKNFQSKLIPTVDINKIIGIRTNRLRAYSKILYENKNYIEFLKKLPHKYFDEYNLHCFLIEKFKNFDEVINETNKILPYIDNWATCDCFNPKIFKKNKKQLLIHIKKWIKSNYPYTVRFGIKNLMAYFLDDDFDEEYLKLVSNINFKSKYKYKKISVTECPDKYYVDMMISWFFQTALVKQYKYAIKYLKNKKFSPFVNNMIIKKSKESFRITNDKKIEISKYVLY